MKSAWLVYTFITQVTTDNIVKWVTRLHTADWDCFKTLILLETLTIPNPLRVELCIFGSGTFVLISWTFKKQTSVSHGSTESEIIALDAGLRMDGQLA